MSCKCECVRCGVCDGKGTLYYDSFGGTEPRAYRVDDLDEMDYCDQCHGGIVEICDFCRDMDEAAANQWDLEDWEIDNAEPHAIDTMWDSIVGFFMIPDKPED